MRRFFIIDKYNTWYDWRLTLTAKEITEAEPKINTVSVDGMSGSWDFTEALTGEVTYHDRNIVMSFSTSEGTHAERVKLLSKITATVQGKKVKFIEPDDTEHYFIGRAVIKNVTKDAVHLSFDIEATCEPWRYDINESERTIAVDGEAVAVIRNEGVKTLCPVLTVTGSVDLTVNGVTSSLTDGVYKITDLRLHQGVNTVALTGQGAIKFTYQEAWL